MIWKLVKNGQFEINVTMIGCSGSYHLSVAVLDVIEHDFGHSYGIETGSKADGNDFSEVVSL